MRVEWWDGLPVVTVVHALHSVGHINSQSYPVPQAQEQFGTLYCFINAHQ